MTAINKQDVTPRQVAYPSVHSTPMCQTQGYLGEISHLDKVS